MTQTLTTETVNALNDKACAALDRLSREMVACARRNYLDSSFVEMRSVVAELLEALCEVANREALPVAEVLSSRSGNDTSTIDKALPAGTKLYTAPPAPAVPGKITPSQAQALCPSKYYVMNGDELNVAADFWNTCRAAMLNGGKS